MSNPEHNDEDRQRINLEMVYVDVDTAIVLDDEKAHHEMALDLMETEQNYPNPF